eukprot:1141846-Pelagomonas_calceolata.AAC.2
MLTQARTGRSRSSPHRVTQIPPSHPKFSVGETSPTYTDGSVMNTKNNSPPQVGSDVYKPNKEGDHPSPQLQLYIKPNGRGPTNTINRAELAGILVALQQGHTNMPTDSVS